MQPIRTTPTAISTVNRQLSIIQCNYYDINYLQYNIAKDEINITNIQKYKEEFEDTYVGTDRTSFYYTKDLISIR